MREPIRYKLVESFGGKVVGEFSLLRDTLNAAKGHMAALDIWTVTGDGMFGLGKVIQHIDAKEKTDAATTH
jgi:hypothetical protein